MAVRRAAFARLLLALPLLSQSLLSLALLSLPLTAHAAGALEGPIERQATNWTAIGMFGAFVALTLAITAWAARRTRTAADFYAAGGGIGGFQNGLAIAGDFMSAASFLGISALIFTAGFDGLLYSVGFLAGWPLTMALMAERLRNVGRYSLADVAAFRLRAAPVRSFAATSSLVVIAFYLIAQMVGAGQLIQLLFGLPYAAAVAIVGVLMILYVSFGGMVATTWVQIIKAVLLLSGATVIALGALARFGFDLDAVLRAAVGTHPAHAAILAPGVQFKSPLSIVSTGMALMLGGTTTPHVMMRFFTVPDARQARLSVFWATLFIGYFYVLTFVIGFSAISLVGGDTAYVTAGKVLGGGNMVAVHLAHAVGGEALKGFISAVAFATILAVVSGLALAGATAVAHDLYANVIRRGAPEAAEVRVGRYASVALGLLAIALGLVFEKQNVAYMVGLAAAINASANFPVLLLNLYWPRFSTGGAVLGGWTGLISAIALTAMGPGIWEKVLGLAHAPFPLESPALVSIPLGFAACVAGALLFPDRAEEARFPALFVRSQTGIGATRAAKH